MRRALASRRKSEGALHEDYEQLEDGDQLHGPVAFRVADVEARQNARHWWPGVLHWRYLTRAARLNTDVGERPGPKAKRPALVAGRFALEVPDNDLVERSPLALLA